MESAPRDRTTTQRRCQLSQPRQGMDKAPKLTTYQLTHDEWHPAESTLHEIEKLKRNFDDIDADHNGCLNREELAEYMMRIYRKAKPHVLTVNRTFVCLDSARRL